MITRTIDYYKGNGFFPLVKKIIAKSLVYLKLVEDIPATRIRLSKHIYELFDGKVEYGPLKGLQLSTILTKIQAIKKLRISSKKQQKLTKS